MTACDSAMKELANTRDAWLHAFIRWKEGELICALAEEYGVSRVTVRQRLAEIDRLVKWARARGDGEMMIRWASHLPRVPRAETEEECKFWFAATREARDREDDLDRVARRRWVARRDRIKKQGRRNSMKAKGSPWPGWRPWIASKGCDVVTDPISRRRMPGERYVECRFCRELIHARDLPPGASVDEPPDACPACGREE